MFKCFRELHWLNSWKLIIKVYGLPFYARNYYVAHPKNAARCLKLLFDQQQTREEIAVRWNCINNFPPPFIFIERSGKNAKKSFIWLITATETVCAETSWSIPQRKMKKATSTWHKHNNYLIFSAFSRLLLCCACSSSWFISFFVHDFEVNGSMISRSNNKEWMKPAAAHKMENFEAVERSSKALGENAISNCA